MRVKSADKFEKIQKAAFRTFIKKGYFHTKIEDITKEAGLGKGTFYQYFCNKEEVLLCSFHQVMESDFTAYQKIAKKAKSSKEFIYNAIDLHYKNLQESKEMVIIYVQVFCLEIHRNKKIKKILVHAQRKLIKYFQLLIRFGKKKMIIKNTKPFLALIPIYLQFLDGSALQYAFLDYSEKDWIKQKKAMYNLIDCIQE